MITHFTRLIYTKSIVQKALMLCAFLFTINLVMAQYFTVPLSTGYPIHIDYLNGSTICQPTSATVQHGVPYYIFGPPLVTPDLISPNEATHHIATAGEERRIIVEVVASGPIVQGNGQGLIYKFGEAGGADEAILLSEFNAGSPSRPGHMRYEIPFKFDRATKKGYVSFVVKDGEFSNGTAIGNWVVIPFTVLGPTINNEYVEALDTIVEPQIPYLILHAPPGDGSSSSFQTSKTTCRKLQTTYAEEGSNSANLAVKIGFAGEAGLFVTTSFEFSVTISAGLTVGDMAYEASSEETCLTVNEGFSTASMLDDQGGGDVFIGYGTDMAVGIYEYLKIEPGACGSTLDTGLIYAPVGDLRQFAKTKSGIEDDIADLMNVVADSANLDPKTVNDAMNQIDVWDQVLALNEANVNDPNNEPVGLSFDLDANATQFREESIQVVNTNTITYEQYTNVNMGVVAKVEVGGSGVKGGYEFKGSKRFGQTQNQTATESKLVKYTLSDDDLGDKFNVQVVRDPMYGTPIFRVSESQSKSSCPYQAGYQRDQPLLTFADGSQEITLNDIPKGTSESFQVKICNDSNEPRTYHLKGNSNTNLDGVVVEGFGNNLFNTNDQGVEFYLIPANQCLNVATLTIRQGNQNILDYEDIELYLNVDCQPGTAPITSSIFINAHFTAPTSTDGAGSNGLSMDIVPNPSYGTTRVLLKGATTGGKLMLTDLSGRGIYQQFVPAGQTSIPLDALQLSPGVYMVAFENEGQRLTKKMVVER